MLKDKNLISALGMFSLVFAVLLGRYVDSTPVVDFFEGLLYGLSIAFNLYALILSRKK